MQRVLNVRQEEEGRKKKEKEQKEKKRSEEKRKGKKELKKKERKKERKTDKQTKERRKPLPLHTRTITATTKTPIRRGEISPSLTTTTVRTQQQPDDVKT